MSELKYFTLHLFIAGKCQNNPCKNGGTCNLVNGNPKCTCINGLTGATCETSKLNCNDVPLYLRKLITHPVDDEDFQKRISFLIRQTQIRQNNNIK